MSRETANSEFDWVHPNGPFVGIRKWLSRGTAILTAIVITLYFIAPTWGGSAETLVWYYGIGILPELLFGYGVLWVIDIVLAYLKHG